MATHYKVFGYTKGTSVVRYVFPCNAGGVVDTGSLHTALQERYDDCVAGTIEGRPVTAYGVVTAPTATPFFVTAPA